MKDHLPTEAVMDIGGGRRLAVADDALAVEVRGSGGSWTRVRVIPYEDIRGLYRYELTNWAALGLLLVLWLVLLVVLLIAAGLGGWSPTMTFATTGLSTLAILAIAVFRSRTSPARMLKIEAYSGMMLVPDRSSPFFARLASQLSLRTTPPAGTPPPQAFQPKVSMSNSELESPPTDGSESP